MVYYGTEQSLLSVLDSAALLQQLASSYIQAIPWIMMTVVEAHILNCEQPPGLFGSEAPLTKP